MSVKIFTPYNYVTPGSDWKDFLSVKFFKLPDIRQKTHNAMLLTCWLTILLVFIGNAALQAQSALPSSGSNVASGTYLIPSGVTSITIQTWGGGGGGGGAKTTDNGDGSAAAGGGGGGGAYATTTVSVSPGQTIIVAVGTAGAGGTSGGNGTAGGTSTITYNSTIVAQAAGGAFGHGVHSADGDNSTGAGGNGGITGTGTIEIGGNGANGIASGVLCCASYGGGGGGGGGSSAGGGNGSGNNTGGTAGATGGGTGGNGGSITARSEDGASNGLTNTSTTTWGAGGGGATAQSDDEDNQSATGGNGQAGNVIITYTAITCTAPASVSLSGYTTPICAGTAPGTFTVTPTGGTPTTYTYQWYNGSGPISGATGNTYAPGNLTANASYYCAVSTGGSCTTNSSTQAIVVNTPGVTTNAATGVTNGGATLNGTD